jgi:hypothetical protein
MGICNNRNLAILLVPKGNHMRTKKPTPLINISEHEFVISFFTHNKKSHFPSESKLFDALKFAVRSINCDYMVHLATYPYISVHVSHGLKDKLIYDKDKVLAVITQTLNSNLI